MGKLLFICCLGMGVFAQRPSFEAAHIKPNNSGSGSSQITSGPGASFKATNTTLRSLIAYSYGVFDYQLAGGPDWMNTRRFDIEGTAAASVTNPDLRSMAQSLLEDRFKLKFHRETREQPVFLLAIAKDGPKLRPHAGSSRTDAGTSGNEISGSGLRVEKLKEMLEQATDRPVIDKTNLNGRYDFVLRYGAPSSIFEALEEQLGLKLEDSTGTVEVLVIDSEQTPP